MLLWITIFAIAISVASMFLGRWFLIPLCFGEDSRSSKEYCAAFRKGALQASLKLVESKYVLPHEIGEHLTLKERYIADDIFVFEYLSWQTSFHDKDRLFVIRDLNDWVCKKNSGAKFVSIHQSLPNLHIINYIDNQRVQTSYSLNICEGKKQIEWESANDQSK